MFNHKTYINLFIDSPRLHFPAPKYGVRVVQADVALGESYWQVIGIHHLLPDQNRGNRNVFIEALDEAGNRITNPPIWAGWAWEGIQPHERADPVPLDKPDNEPAGNISVGSNQKISVWIKGRSRASNDVSDRVEGLHTLHPDEPGPNGENWNSLGHHSFLVVFQRRKKTAGGPVVVPPVEEPGEEEPTPGPVDWLTHFDERQRKQIAFSRLYAKDFSHGATGHNDMLIIAKMAELLDGKA